MRPVYFDIHSHLNLESFDEDRDAVIAQMQDERVWTITVGVDAASSKRACDISKMWDGLFATVGLHPTDSAEESFDESYYRSLVDEYSRVVAIGECGMDFYRTPSEQLKEEKIRQTNTFEQQIEFAASVDKPLMIHCRDAHRDVIDILKSKQKHYGEKIRGDVHFFTGNIDTAKQYFDLGFTISFTGVLTFARDYDELVRFAPLEMIMSETDAPFAAPVPFRGKRCEPPHVAQVVKAIAGIKGISEEDVQVALVKNAFRVFSLESSW